MTRAGGRTILGQALPPVKPAPSPVPTRSDLSTNPLQLALARLLVASAWADGELDDAERRGLRRLLLRLPGLGDAEWAVLTRDLDNPASAGQRDAHFRALQQMIAVPADREFAVQALQRFAEEATTDDSIEAATITEILDDLDAWAPSPGLLERARGFVSGLLGSRRRELEDYLERWRGFEEGPLPALVAEVEQRSGEPLDRDQLHKLCVAAALLGRVAHADGELEEEERAAMGRALREHLGLPTAACELVTELVLRDISTGHDLYGLIRDFTRLSDEGERAAFLHVLFAVAAADGTATPDEVEEIRRISRGFLLRHRHFIAAKLAVPAERRAP